jgi:lipopolysaccharide biosynthesis regulator YciM
VTGTGLLLGLLALGILAAGVLIGRYYVPDDRALRRSARHAEAYLLALEHLLARNRDAAIDQLRSVVAENVTKIGPYFALAALFRARGEWERAIRIHQAIAIRRDASRADKLRARFELGLDCRAAGMPRRATRAMEDVALADPKHLGALRALTGLYEEQGRFADAAEVWGRLRKLTGEEPVREPHLLAAAVQQAVEVGDLDSARQHIKRATKLAAGSPHVLAAAAELDAARGNPGDAADKLREALRRAPDWAVHLVPALLETELLQLGGAGETGDGDHGADEWDVGEALRRRAAERTVAMLETLQGEVGAAPFVLIAIAELQSHYDPEGALASFRDAAARFPDLLPARVAAGRLALSSGDDEEIRGELLALVGPEGALAWAIEGTWRCRHCGRRDEAFFWRCDGCRQWGTGALDLGRASQDVPAAPRERRVEPRQKSLWGPESRALPAPAIAGEPAALEAAAGIRPGMWGRARRWLASTLGD